MSQTAATVNSWKFEVVNKGPAAKRATEARVSDAPAPARIDASGTSLLASPAAGGTTRNGRSGDDGSTRSGSIELGVVLRFVDIAADALAEAREEIDALNVYPVPDGDTGTNMFLTVSAARDASGEATGRRTPADADRRAALAAFSRGALLGARGNSGVIFSEMLRRALPPDRRRRTRRAERRDHGRRAPGGRRRRLRRGRHPGRGHHPHRGAGRRRRRRATRWPRARPAPGEVFTAAAPGRPRGPGPDPRPAPGAGRGGRGRRGRPRPERRARRRRDRAHRSPPGAGDRADRRHTIPMPVAGAATSPRTDPPTR